MNLPLTYTERDETNCCAFPNIHDWDEKIVEFVEKRFIKGYTKSALFVPLNMGKVMSDLQERASSAGATMPPREAMILSRDLSPWKAEHLYAVSKTVEGVENISLNGKFIAKVFEGPYKNAKEWHATLTALGKKNGGDGKMNYLFYTTCPNCAKVYGKNYVIGLSRISE